MPGKDTIHTAKWDRCVKKLEDMGKSKSSAAAICSSSIDDAGVKKGHQKKDKKDYYANRKKAEKMNEGVLRFDDFSINEDYDDGGFSGVFTPEYNDDKEYEKVLSKILYTTNIDYINNINGCENKLEEALDNLKIIKELINREFPYIEEDEN